MSNLKHNCSNNFAKTQRKHQINHQLLQGIVWCMLNNYMDDLTRTQQQLTKTNDAQTTAWLSDNGMTENI